MAKRSALEYQSPGFPSCRKQGFGLSPVRFFLLQWQEHPSERFDPGMSHTASPGVQGVRIEEKVALKKQVPGHKAPGIFFYGSGFIHKAAF